MSVSYNEKDFNVPAIVGASGVLAAPTRYRYRVYGLKQKNNPAILIECRTGGNVNAFAPLVKFFNSNNIYCESGRVDDENGRLFIGLRHDLRENDKLATAVLQTIIHHLEGKLKGNLDFKIKCKEYPNYIAPKRKKIIRKVKWNDKDFDADESFARFIGSEP